MAAAFETITFVEPPATGETVNVVFVIEAFAIPAGVGDAVNAPL
jgi:hypothetical protein